MDDYADRKVAAIIARVEATGCGYDKAVAWVEETYPDLRPQEDCDRVSGRHMSWYECVCNRMCNPV
jgi:hypothetical protein